MRARAPGKLVVSGAYAVLHGAPAIVTAVTRYAIADTARPAERVTPEVRAALGTAAAPWFDASELRGPKGKLGLGSSAAILVASLAALALDAGAAGDDASLAGAVLERALDAHRVAQGGGSGVDVLCSALGGSLVARRSDGGLVSDRIALPGALSWEVWAGGAPASTAHFVAKVEELAAREPSRFETHMASLCTAAVEAAAAASAGRAGDLLTHLDAQRRGLGALGQAAGVEIVTADVAELGAIAAREGAVVLPSGAGGGDVALFVGRGPPSAELCARRSALGHAVLELSLGARGVHAW